MSGDELGRELPPALKAIVDEVRDAPPDVDWSRLEARLFDDQGELREELRAAPAPEPTWRIGVGVALGLAAAAAIAGIFALPREAPRPTARTEAQAPAAPLSAGPASATPHESAHAPMLAIGAGHEARVLRVGDVIDATSADGEWIQSAGRLHAHVAADTKIRLLEDGDRMRFALSEGEISADVTPVPGGEPYAIDVDGRRVAVHGTRLSVRKSDGAVEVAVADGLAAIGVPVEGRTTGIDVTAGSIGRFVGLGAPELRVDPLEAARRVARGLASSVPSAAPTATLVGLPSFKPSIPQAPIAPPPTLSATPGTSTTATAGTSEAPGLGAREYGPPLWSLQQAVKGCVPHTASGVLVNIEESMTVTVLPSGDVGALTFNPPLSPELDGCARKAQGSIKFPAAAGSTTVERDVTLGSSR